MPRKTSTSRPSNKNRIEILKTRDKLIKLRKLSRDKLIKLRTLLDQFLTRVEKGILSFFSIRSWSGLVDPIMILKDGTFSRTRKILPTYGHSFLYLSTLPRKKENYKQSWNWQSLITIFSWRARWIILTILRRSRISSEIFLNPFSAPGKERGRIRYRSILRQLTWACSLTSHTRFFVWLL